MDTSSGIIPYLSAVLFFLYMHEQWKVFSCTVKSTCCVDLNPAPDLLSFLKGRTLSGPDFISNNKSIVLSKLISFSSIPYNKNPIKDLMWNCPSPSNHRPFKLKRWDKRGFHLQAGHVWAPAQPSSPSSAHWHRSPPYGPRWGEKSWSGSSPWVEPRGSPSRGPDACGKCHQQTEFPLSGHKTLITWGENWVTLTV